MKFISYLDKDKEQLGLFTGGFIYNLSRTATQLNKAPLPDTMAEFLRAGESAMQTAREIFEILISNQIELNKIPIESTELLAPVPHPTSCRDGYAFRQHVETARKNRNAGMLPEFDQFPVFYFTNHNSITGPGNIYCMPDHFHKLDFELEAAVVIGKKGININAKEADEYIAGYLIMNDFSARTLQMEEMILNLGPAKGKDFATAIGPWLVTPDELQAFIKPTKHGHVGLQFDLTMTCKVNNIEVSRGNLGDMDWTFAELIERASYGTHVLPGDVIGSGTVGTGCFLELNGTGLRNDKKYTEQWLKENDVIELEITGLGILRNTIKKTHSEFSILSEKKLI